MTKRANRKFRISRKLGCNLWGRAKDPVDKKNYPPGQHGVRGYKKKSDYGVQLDAKQMLKFYYGNIGEKQFRAIYKEAARSKGDTGENLIGLLESRLDAFLYRSMIAPTVFASRQLVSHKHILINGKVVNIPSYRLKVGDVVELRDKSKSIQLILDSLESKEREIPLYISLNQGKKQAKYIKVPLFAEVPYQVEMKPNLVVEYYSR